MNLFWTDIESILENSDISNNDATNEAFPFDESGSIELDSILIEEYIPVMESVYVVNAEALTLNVITENAMKSFWEKLKKFFKTIWEKIKSFFQWIKNSFKKKQKDISQQLNDAIKKINNKADAMHQAVINKAKQMAKDQGKDEGDYGDYLDEIALGLAQENFHFVKSVDLKSKTFIIDRTKTKYNFLNMVGSSNVEISKMINNMMDSVKIAHQNCMEMIMGAEKGEDFKEMLEELRANSIVGLNIFSSHMNKSLTSFSDITIEDINQMYSGGANEEKLDGKLLKDFLNNPKGPHGALEKLDKITNSFVKLEAEHTKFVNDASKKSSSNSQEVVQIANFFTQTSSAIMSVTKNFIDIFSKATNESMDMYNSIFHKELRPLWVTLQMLS